MALDRRDWLIVVPSAAAFAAVLWLSGWLSPWIVSDTKGYLAYAPYPEFYFQQRLPFYGWLVTGLGGEKSLHAVIWFHLILHTLAAVMLYFSIRRLGAGKEAAAALFFTALVSQGFLIFGRGVVPESIATSLALIAMAFTLLAVSAGPWIVWVALAGVAAAAACLLRPTFLPLIGTLPVLFLFAARVSGHRIVARRVAMLLLATLIPIVAYMADRSRHTGDFKPVAFGGFQMSGLAGLILTNEIVQRLPEPDRALAAQILSLREQAEAAGRVIRTPVNSTGERSFVSAAIGYFDIYARTHDDLLYSEILKARSPDEPWVLFDRRLQRFAFAAIMNAPERYAAWVAGASSRLAGRMIVTNAPFVLASVGLLVVFLLLLRKPDALRRMTAPGDWPLVIGIVALYILSAAPLAVLITFPASRYIDTAAALLAAIPLFAAIRLATLLRRPVAS